MTRSNLGIRRQARDSRPIEEIRAWLTGLRTRNPRYNAVPARLRPSTPRNRRLIATGDWQQVSDYARKLCAICTKRQWQHIEKLYFGRLTG